MLTFQNAAELRAYPATGIADGDLAYLETFRDYFVRHGASLGEDDGATVISGWRRLRIPHPEWMDQTEWVIDELNTTGLASDENSGATATRPLRTAAERWRRMGPSPRWKASTAYHIRHLSTCAAEAIDGETADTNTTIYIHGSMTDRAGDQVFAGTATTVQALDTANNLANEIVSASIPVSWATAGSGGTSLVARRIRMTSGASINAISWIVLDMGGAAPNARARCAEFLTPVASFNVAPFVAPAATTAVIANGDTFVVEDLRTITRLSVTLRNTAGIPSNSRVILDSVAINLRESPYVGIYSDGCQITSTAASGAFANHIMHSCRLGTISDPSAKSIVGGYAPSGVTLDNRATAGTSFTRWTIQGAQVVTLGGGSTNGGLAFIVGQVGIFDTSAPPLLFAGYGNRIQNTVLYGSGNTSQILRFMQGARIVLTSFTSTPVVTSASTHVQLYATTPRTAAPALDESGGTPVWTALRNLTFTTMMQTIAAGGFGPIWTDPVSGAGWTN